MYYLILFINLNHFIIIPDWDSELIKSDWKNKSFKMYYKLLKADSKLIPMCDYILEHLSVNKHFQKNLTFKNNFAILKNVIIKIGNIIPKYSYDVRKIFFKFIQNVIEAFFS